MSLRCVGVLAVGVPVGELMDRVAVPTPVVLAPEDLLDARVELRSEQIGRRLEGHMRTDLVDHGMRAVARTRRHLPHHQVIAVVGVDLLHARRADGARRDPAGGRLEGQQTPVERQRRVRAVTIAAERELAQLMRVSSKRKISTAARFAAGAAVVGAVGVEGDPLGQRLLREREVGLEGVGHRRMVRRAGAVCDPKEEGLRRVRAHRRRGRSRLAVLADPIEMLPDEDLATGAAVPEQVLGGRERVVPGPASSRTVRVPPGRTAPGLSRCSASADPAKAASAIPVSNPIGSRARRPTTVRISL